MQDDVCPASDGIGRGQFPGLEAIFVVEIVSRLPVVEDLIAVLDRAEDSGQSVGSEEDVERKDGFNMKLVLLCAAVIVRGQ